MNTITSMAHSNPRQFVAVVVLPNRSGDLRLPTKFLDVFMFSLVILFLCDFASCL